MTSGKSVIITQNQWDTLPPGGFRNVTWGLEVRELTLDCQVAKGMMPALFMSQDFLYWIIGTHFLI